MRFFSKTTIRIVTCFGLIVAFVLIASIIQPGDGQASRDDNLRKVPLLMDNSTDPHAGLKSLGSLESNKFTVVFYPSPDGPRFSFYDKDGNLLAALISEEQALSIFNDPVLKERVADLMLKSRTGLMDASQPLDSPFD